MRRLHVGYFDKLYCAWSPFVMFMRIGMWFAVMLFDLMLMGCRPSSVNDLPELPHKMLGAQDRAMMEMQAHFDKQGVRVITMGQDYLISIPAAALFATESPRLLWGSYALLNDVVCYLKQFHKIGVTVTAFSSPYVSAHRDRALTLARARAVGDYLWSQHIDSRFIFTQGLGSDKPIVGIEGGGDKSPNARIEITFRDAVA